MLRCPAYSVLSLSGRRVLDRIEIEMADHGGTDNGKLPVTYDDFERYGIHRHCIGPAIREVVALALLWQIYSSCMFAHIHLWQCGHRFGGIRAMRATMA